ncbi:MAG: penicillin-binding protein 1C [Thiothrix sp.]|uniref:penicillin-binding protein 1C n=1 Tax=Thiothrix sp. TaxID=1032 RepID=UPI002610B9B2|nr:penicillin-binding protein 1C [Thiothrix sp.]MDD5391971.1 penicillin-binding protein 1C [Thiothrix sp.]
MWRRGVRYGSGVLLAGTALCLLFLFADWAWPLPDPDRVRSVLILAEDRTPLRAFADSAGVWRYPVTLDEVSPLYVEALLEYEDRWFYQHPGINPLALARAGWQWLVNGKPVSGGSTLTMQVARILDPHSRDVGGKFRQMFRALQLEWHYSKDEILTFYLNLAPFGGPIEGVQTASFAWLHKSAQSLSHAEAALLAVLPQAPSRLRPDRHPEVAQQYRDKVLQRMAAQGIWSEETVADAALEPVVRSRFQQPLMAPLFAQRMKARAFAENRARLQTALSANMQWAVENVVRTRQNALPEKSSIGVLVVENQTGYVRAYAGSADFHSAERFGHVDMVQAWRSPGSTLKPFLYGLALDEGLIHSASLLSDVPIKLDDYAPQNFFRHFSGAVSVTQALQQSLNVPAVDMLQRLTPARFVARLRNGGVEIRFPENTAPNLSVILGGAGTRLEDLVRGFTAFARNGISIAPRFVPDDPVVERRMLSAGAAWIIQDILRGVEPPEGSVNPEGIAWKTGTSYGFRDAWAVGVSDRYTVGVWTGRPDGTPLPGSFGAHAAAPILFDIFRALPKARASNSRQRPPDVSSTDICWPLGESAANTPAEHCHVRQQAWVLDGHIPPTLPNLQKDSWSARLQTYWINPQTGLRVTADCTAPQRLEHTFAQWPVELSPWLVDALLDKMRLPAFDASCPPDMRLQAGKELLIRHLDASTRLYLQARGVSIDLLAEGGQGRYLWLVNGDVAGVDEGHKGLRYTFTQPGDYDLVVLDSAGAVDKVSIRVISPP